MVELLEEVAYCATYYVVAPVVCVFLIGFAVGVWFTLRSEEFIKEVKL